MSQLTKSIWLKHANLLGASQIASPKALRIIEHFLDKFLSELEPSASKISSEKSSAISLQHSKMVLEDKLKQGVVIEIGAGIGTITDLISSKLRHTTQQISLICYEVNDFCIDQLYKNVNGPFFHIRNLSDLHSYNLGCRKVFLIIDDYISYDDTKYLLEAINPRYVIIEGHRFRQRKAVAKILLNKSIRIRFFGNSIDSVKGACVIIVKTNKYSLLTLLAYWRLILQSSLLTRKIFQSIGIRKRKFLRLLYR